MCGIGATTVTVATRDGAVVAEHPRAYGAAPTDTSDPASQLALLCRRPGAWANSKARASLPDALRAHMDSLPRADLKAELRLMRDQAAETGWAATVEAMAGALAATGRVDRASVAVCAARILGGGISYDEPVDLSEYDSALAKAMFFSNETVEAFLAGASAAQVRCVCDLISAEQGVRERNKRARLYRKAAFPQAKSFEGYDFSQVSFPEGYGPGDLMSLSFVDAAQDFVFHGPTGRGKTHLAIAVGSACVQAGRSVRFFTTAQLVLMLSRASREHSLEAALRDVAKADLVILDEFGYVPLDVEGGRLLFQVMSDCYEKRSVIVTTNIEFGKWGAVFGDDKLAAAAIDRLVHHGRLVEFGGASRRMGAALMLGKEEG